MRQKILEEKGKIQTEKTNNLKVFFRNLIKS